MSLNLLKSDRAYIFLVRQFPVMLYYKNKNAILNCSRVKLSSLWFNLARNELSIHPRVALQSYINMIIQTGISICITSV